MDENRELFTTGQAAEICRISQQTIIRCFDSGKLQGFRVPGSRFRRIPRDSLIRFMKENGIPLDNLFKTQAAQKIKVLVVDDDPEILDVVVEALNRDGRFEVKTASSGYEAGLMTQQFMPDVILLDYMLPDINGNVVCQTLRRNPEFAKIRIMIVSGVADQEQIQMLLAAGACDFIKKPFDINYLIDRIAQSVGQPMALSS